GSVQLECNACHFAYIYEIFNTCWEAVVSGRSRSHCQLFWAQQQHGRCAFGERSGPAQERTTIAGTEHHSAPDVFLHDSLYKRALADETCNEGVDRSLIEFGRAAVLNDPSLVHQGNSIGKRQGLFLIVGDVEDCDP